MSTRKFIYMAISQPDLIRPPYLPYATFARQLQRWAENPDALPGRIDASVLSTMSGGVQSQFLVALRFFGLVAGDEDHSTKRLHEVIRMDDVDYRAWLSLEIQTLYESAFALSQQSGTGKQLGELFESEYGYRGSTRDKAIRFFLQAAQGADVTVSPHFAVPRAAQSRPRRTQPRSREEAPEAAPAVAAPRLDPAIQAIVSKLPHSGEEWGPAERRRWLNALNAVFDIVYSSPDPDDDGDEYDYDD